MPTLDPTQKLDAVAVAIAARFQTILAANLTVYDYEPAGEALRPPCITVGACDFQRVGVEDAESQLGSDDWALTYTVTILVPLDRQDRAFTDARRLTGQAIHAIDMDQTLGGEVLEAKLVTGEMGFNDPQDARRLIVVECELEALALMPTT